MSDMSADQFASFLEAQVSKSKPKPEQKPQPTSSQPTQQTPPPIQQRLTIPQGFTPTSIPPALQQQIAAAQSKLNELVQKFQSKQITKQEFDQQYVQLMQQQQLATQQMMRGQPMFGQQFRPPQQAPIQPVQQPQKQQVVAQPKVSVKQLSPEMQKLLVEYYKTPREQKQKFLEKHPPLVEILKQQIALRQKQQQQLQQQIVKKPPIQPVQQLQIKQQVIPPPSKEIKRPAPPPPISKQPPPKKQKVAPPLPGEKRGPGRPKATNETNLSDLTDVLAGVNLEKETTTLLVEEEEEVAPVVKYVPEEWFLNKDALRQKMLQIATEAGLKNVDDECLELMSLATQDRMRTMIEGIVQAAKFRREEMEHEKRADILEKVMEEQTELKRRTRMKLFSGAKQLEEEPTETTEEMEISSPEKRLPVQDEAKIRITKGDVLFYLESQIPTRKSKQLHGMYLRV